MYNQLLENLCEQLCENYRNYNENMKSTVVWRLGSFVEGKKASPAYQEKVVELDKYFKEQSLSFEKEAIYLLSFASLCLNEKIEYQQYDTPDLGYLSYFVSGLSREEEETFVDKGYIPILLEKVSADTKQAYLRFDRNKAKEKSK